MAGLVSESCRSCRNREAEIDRAKGEISRLARLVIRAEDRPTQRAKYLAQLEEAKRQKVRAQNALDEHECATIAHSPLTEG